MSSSMNQIASDLYKSLTESNNRKPKPYDTKAEVLREEGNTVWVKIPGGIDETPVQKTNNAKAGDTVMVRVSGGRAWLLGNNTSPATDDTRANQAYQVGSDAGAVADLAIKEASRAQEAADSAVISAGVAKTAADEAKTDAASAHAAAESATLGLSMVEDIVGVLDWIGDHSTVTTDTSPVAGKTYYKKNQDGTYTRIEDPTGKDPASEGWYELDEAIQDFINSHLSLTGVGLYLANMNNGWKVLISSGADSEYPAGVYLIDPSGNAAQATTASGITFDQTKAFTIGNNNAFIFFNPADGGSITISGNHINLGSNMTLNDLLTEVDGTLIFDTTYTVSNGIATFTAHVYRGGVDIAQTKYSATDFSWSLKRELSEAEALLYPEGYIPQGTGYTKTFNIADCGYGAEVIATFIPPEDAELLNQEGDNLTTSEDENLIVRATGNSVRVRDLEVSTTIYATDKLMAVGDTDEHLVTADTLYQYLLTRLEQETLTLYCGTATELVG